MLPVTSNRSAFAPALATWTPGSPSSPERALESDLDGLRAQVPKLSQRSLVDQAPVAQDAHPVAECLDLAQNVRGQEDGLTPLLGPWTESRNTISISGSSPVSAHRVAGGRRGWRAPRSSCTF